MKMLKAYPRAQFLSMSINLTDGSSVSLSMSTQHGLSLRDIICLEINLRNRRLKDGILNADRLLKDRVLSRDRRMNDGILSLGRPLDDGIQRRSHCRSGHRDRSGDWTDNNSGLTIAEEEGGITVKFVKLPGDVAAGTRRVVGHSCLGRYGVDNNVWDATLDDTRGGNDSDN